MNQPRYMDSKFASKCCDCGNTINAGERIRYLGRSKAECKRCMPPENGGTVKQPVTAGAPDDWASALAWSAPTQAPHSPPAGEPAIIANHPQSAKSQFESGNPSAKPSDDQLADIGRTIIDQAQTRATVTPIEAAKPEPVKIDRDNPPITGDSVAIVRDLLVLLVNAIDNADRDQRAALDGFARDMVRNASTMPRSRIWAALADAINQ